MIRSGSLPTCDDVFETLTSGPFPTGAADVDFPIQRHLSVCLSCRDLAESLRPATNLLTENLPESSEGEWALPVYHAAADSGLSLRCSIDQDGHYVSPRSGRRKLSMLATMGLCLVVFLGAVGGFWMAYQLEGPTPPDSFRGSVAADPISLPRPMLQMANFSALSCSLPALENESRRENAKASGESLKAIRCCSQCHHAGDESPEENRAKALRPEILAKIVTRCSSCHISK